MNAIINNFIFFTFGIFYYFIGILIKYFNFNLFESYLLITFIIIYGFLSSNLFIIRDNIHPSTTLKNLFNLSFKEKIILIFSCCPFYKLIVLSYINLDPVIIQLINSLRICINPIIYSLYYKEYYLFNLILIISILINVIACIIPLIFNDNFTLTNLNKINDFSIISIFNTIICMILTTINNIFNEKICIKYDLINNFGLNTFIVYTFIIIDLLFSLLLIPIIFIINYFLNNYNIDNLISLQNFYLINILGCLIGLLYGPYNILVNKCYLKITSLNVCIMNNLVLITTIIISCLLKISLFHYLYIPSIILIILTSIIITFKVEKLKN